MVNRATHIAEGVVVVHASRAGDRVWAYITVAEQAVVEQLGSGGQVRCCHRHPGSRRRQKVKAGFSFTINLGLGIGGYRQGRRG